MECKKHQELLSLDIGETHLWFTSYNKINEDLLDNYYNILNDEEKAQESRFLFMDDRRRYLVTRALVRTTLSRYVSVEPATWKFIKNTFGRPEILIADAKDNKLSFNISHTTGLIVLALRRDGIVGVDVEKWSDHKMGLDVDLVKLCLTNNEIMDLNTIEPNDQLHRFLEYWTLKESYTKARGMGLSIPFDKISFRFKADNSIDISLNAELFDTALRWIFRQYKLENYIIALCTELNNTYTDRMIIYDAIPFFSEKEISMPLYRSSESNSLSA